MRSIKRFFSKWQNWLGLILVCLFLFMTIAAPLLSPQDPDQPGAVKLVGTSRSRVPQPPSAEAPLGTLANRASVYHYLVWGTRSAVGFGLIVTLSSMFIGVLIGTLSAFSTRWLNNLLMRITDAFLAFPLIAGVVMFSQLRNILLSNAGVMSFTTMGTSYMVLPEGVPHWLPFILKMDPLMISFILLTWMPYARIMNSVVRRVRNFQFIESARVSGTRPLRIITRHILPNSISPAVIMAARDVGGLVILQTTFAFIGMGGNSPWANSLVYSRDWIISAGGRFEYWWVFLPITITIILFGIGWSLLGDGLNDLLNPHNN